MSTISGLRPVEAPSREAPKVDENTKDRAKIKEVAEEFESLFLGLVLKSMRDTVHKTGLVDGGNGEEIFRSMLDVEYAKNMAAQRHTGLADNIEQFLLKSMSDTSATPSPQKSSIDPATRAAALKAYDRLKPRGDL